MSHEVGALISVLLMIQMWWTSKQNIAEFQQNTRTSRSYHMCNVNLKTKMIVRLETPPKNNTQNNSSHLEMWSMIAPFFPKFYEIVLHILYNDMDVTLLTFLKDDD